MQAGASPSPPHPPKMLQGAHGQGLSWSCSSSMRAEQMQPVNANVPWERALPVLSGRATRQQIISVALQQGEGDPHLTARAVSLGGVTKQHPLPRADGSSSAEKLQQLCWAKPGGMLASSQHSLATWKGRRQSCVMMDRPWSTAGAGQGQDAPVPLCTAPATTLQVPAALRK